MTSFENAALTEQEGSWINEVADRLRLIQTDPAAAEPRQRHEFLHEELGRSLSKAAPVDRKRYLEALLARFPVSGQLLKNIVVASAPPPTTAPAPGTFSQLLDHLIKAATDLDENERAQAAKRLNEVGLAPVATETFLPEAVQDIEKAFGLPAGERLNLQNALRLCALLVDSYQRLDQTALATLRDLSPRCSLLKRPQDFRAAATAFLTGQSDSIEPYLRVVSGLLGALLAAMLGGGRDFGRHFVERLSPTAIEDVVVGEGGGNSLFGKSKKERCWERYVLLCKELETADLVERRLRDCLAAFVEKKVLSAR